MTTFSLPFKTTHVGPNYIRQVNEDGAKIPGFISLAVGNPSADAIPSQALRQQIETLMQGNLLTLFEYGPAGGDETYKALTKKRLVEKKGFPADHHSVVVLNGSTQGLGLAPRTFCNEGDEIYFEEFSFTGAIRAARAAGCIAVGIAADEEGMMPDALAKAASSGRGKMIYMNPNFHNPTGATMSLQRRKDIYAVAQKYDLLIYEDDPYGDIRFHGEHVPCFKTIDPDDRVIFAGSYSKTISPGLRMGYLYASDNFVSYLRNTESAMDGQPPLLNQLVIAHTLQSIDYEAHIDEICRMYKRRCDILIDALTQYADPSVSWLRPDGGMFLWVTIPDSVSMDDFYSEMMSHGVGAVRSEGFAVDPEQRGGHSFRLNFTYGTEDMLVEGAKRFGAVTRQLCKPIAASAH